MRLLARMGSAVVVLLPGGAKREARTRTFARLRTAGVAAGILVLATTACQTTPAQLSLWHPAQVFPEETKVHGLRVNLLYGSNERVYGIDTGLVNQTLENMFGFQGGAVNNIGGAGAGLQVGGLFNEVAADFRGFQLGGWNRAEGAAKGIQLAHGHIFPLGVNRVEELRGGQVATGWNSTEGAARGFQVAVLLNVADEMSGLQLGLVNFTSSEGDEPSLRGAQVGLLNRTHSLKGLQFGLFNQTSREGDEASPRGAQLGLVNHAHSFKGVQLGLLNFNREGFLPVFPLINIGF